MNLIQKQKVFSVKVAELLLRAKELGYEVTLGEAWRPPETAALYATQGKGISKSLHTSRLAIDINLFYEGKLLSLSEQYKALGTWWEGQSTDLYTCVWGGRFNDGNHFSIEHGGVK